MSISNDSNLDELSVIADIGSPSPDAFPEPSNPLFETAQLEEAKRKMSMRYLAFINVLLVLPTGTLSPPIYLFVDTLKGIVIAPDEAKQEETEVINVHGMILSPGLIDIQINGAYGVDLSEWKGDEVEYKDRLRHMGEGLVKSGVTSYVPTLITQEAKVYHSIIPLVQSTAANTIADPNSTTSTPLGVHLEGPFISPKKPGCHPVENLANTTGGMADIDKMYGAQALAAYAPGLNAESNQKNPVRIITIAPEIPGALDAIEEMSRRGVVVSLGHTDATHDQALGGVAHGATLLTHLFNAMPPLHHRHPGVIGLLGLPEESYPGTPTVGALKLHSAMPSPTTTPLKSPLWSRAGSRVPSPVQEEEYEPTDETLQAIILSGNPAALFAHIATVQGDDSTKLSTLASKRKMKDLKIDVGSVKPRRETWPRTPRTPGTGQSTKSSTPVSTNEGLWQGRMIKRPSFSIIADGVHVHPQAVAMAYNTHPEGCVLVSDAMSMMDPKLQDGVYEWREGSKIEKKDGAIMLAGTDTLAGSILPLTQAVRNLSYFAGIPFYQALYCATLNPAKSLGGWIERSKGVIEVGYDADFCLWDHDGSLRRVWVAGKEVDGAGDEFEEASDDWTKL